MDAAIFPNMLNFSQLPVSPPPDHKLFFSKHSPSQAPAAVFNTNPLLMKSFAREMEGPTVKKAPSLLEKHYSQEQQRREKTKRAEEILFSQKSSIPQKQNLPNTPSTITASSTSTLSTSAPSSADIKTTLPTPQQQQQTTSSSSSSPPPPPPQQQQQQQQYQRPFSPPENPFLNPADPNGTVDPKYIQMVSRMAAYYQQRCQAILNFQQQRCQTWAASHRQKCQEMMQAAMLVVAWYIRDRIGRRRRRNKRAFRRGLREKNSAAAIRKTPKGETVRKWVMDIPDTSAIATIAAAAAMPSSSSTSIHHPPSPMFPQDEMNTTAGATAVPSPALDKDEREFDVEKEVTLDKDSQLFAVADQMIKSQLAKIDVPLLGALNLDNSDSESEDDDDEDEDMDDARYYYGPEDYEMEGGVGEAGEGEYDEDDDDDDDDDLDYEEETEEYVEDVASKEALHGTGKGSLKRKRSESTSLVE